MSDNLVGLANESPEDKPGVESSGNDKRKTFIVRSYEPITTADDAFEKAGLDPAIWQVTKVIANSWEVFAEGSHRNLWQVKIECRRNLPKAIEIASELIAKRVRKSPIPKIPKPRRRRGPKHTAVMGLVDHHFGKLCWSPETLGKSYDLPTAQKLWTNATHALIENVRRYNVCEVVLPIGNDMGHFDNRAGTTESGTPQDSDSRYAKVCDAMENSLIGTIHLLAENFPRVRVIWVGGNHDYLTSFWLCRMARQAFRENKRIEFDLTPSPQKYYQFGKCLIGFAHGNAPKKNSLMAMMPIDVPDLWAKSTAAREWHTGHFHGKETTTRIGTHEQAGMIYRVLPSLCPPDAWHAQNGYTMNRQATESYVYCHEFGLKGYFTEPAEALI